MVVARGLNGLNRSRTGGLDHSSEALWWKRSTWHASATEWHWQILYYAILGRILYQCSYVRVKTVNSRSNYDYNSTITIFAPRVHRTRTHGAGICLPCLSNRQFEHCWNHDHVEIMSKWLTKLADRTLPVAMRIFFQGPAQP
jgi:hypothetical protein